MPKTTIQIKTMMCPTGLGNPNASCRFHRAIDNLPKDGLCPIHRLKLEKTTDPQDKITKTVIGEEDIETEIEEKEKTVEKEHKEKNLLGSAPKMSNKEKTEYRNKRKQDIKEAIANAKKYEDNH